MGFLTADSGGETLVPRRYVLWLIGLIVLSGAGVAIHNYYSPDGGRTVSVEPAKECDACTLRHQRLVRDKQSPEKKLRDLYNRSKQSETPAQRQ